MASFVECALVALSPKLNPVHTLSDGLATTSPVMTVLCVLTAEAVAFATVQAVRAAQGLQVKAMWLPGVGDLE